jgi:uncharacterized repeat protein (TIGR03803 family)
MNKGAVFKLSANGDLSLVASFDGTNGYNSYSGLLLCTNGDLYGCSPYGGIGNFGTIFRVSQDGALSFVAYFSGTNGAEPRCVLLLANDGSFYGTTFSGGANNYGTVFRFSPSGTLATLASFDYYGTGVQPFAGLVQGPDGNLYGDTTGGGSGGQVFRLTLAGAVTVLPGLNGEEPHDLFAAKDGTIYGSTRQGGPPGYGTVFSMTTNGVFTTLAAFPYVEPNSTSCSLVQGSGGNFYGTSLGGGAQDSGTVYRVTPHGDMTVLASFASTNGSLPACSLLQGQDGAFYGTANQAGPAGYGTIFKLTTNLQLISFAPFGYTNGANPLGSLVQDSSGNFYGVCTGGGRAPLGFGYGGAFRVSPSGVLTPLVFFNLSTGVQPSAGLVLASDGNFYGTLSSGGTNNNGTVFRLNVAGGYTNLVYFRGTNGANPHSPLLQGTDGNLYGTTRSGGAAGQGTFFRLTLDGQFTSLASFPSSPTSLRQPTGALVQGSDSAFYGIAIGSFAASLFRATTNGALTQLMSLPSLFNQPGLCAANDGTLYATTSLGNGRILRFVLQTITNIQVTNGNPLLTLSALPGQSYIIQSSTNLTAALWQSVSTNVADSNGLLQFIDPAGTSMPARVYRTALY